MFGSLFFLPCLFLCVSVFVCVCNIIQMGQPSFLECWHNINADWEFFMEHVHASHTYTLYVWDMCDTSVKQIWHVCETCVRNTRIDYMCETYLKCKFQKCGAFAILMCETQGLLRIHPRCCTCGHVFTLTQRTYTTHSDRQKEWDIRTHTNDRDTYVKHIWNTCTHTHIHR